MSGTGRNRGCGAADEAGHICKRQPGHPGVHEHYDHGKTASWPNAAGWLVAEGRDTDGPYWWLANGSERDERKFDTRAAAEAMCESLNLRGSSRQ